MFQIQKISSFDAPGLQPYATLRLARKIKPTYRFPMSKERAYHSDPEILGGTLVFKGTRVPVQSLFDHLKAGDSIEDFLEFATLKGYHLTTSCVRKPFRTFNTFQPSGESGR